MLQLRKNPDDTFAIINRHPGGFPTLLPTSDGYLFVDHGQLILNDQGKRLDVLPIPEISLGLRVSPDGKWVAFGTNETDEWGTEAVFGVAPLLQTGEHRRAAKAINFGIVYGLSSFGLAQQLTISKGEAQHFIDEYFAQYAGVRKYLDSILETARVDNFVTTILGRRRPIPGLNSKNATNRGFAERTATNTPLQGSAADLIKVAMVRIHRELQMGGYQARLLLQVHDELVLEAPESELDAVKKLTRDTMENAMQLSVPIVTSLGVGLNWRDAK